MWNARWRLVGIFAVSLVCTAMGQPTAFYVSPAPAGDDNHTGTSPDSAFATLTRARDAIRAAKASSAGDFEVLIADGEYPLTGTFELTEADSAPAGHTITYKAISDRIPSVLLTGGVPLPTGWQHQFAPGGIFWKLQLGGPASPDWEFRDLYFRNARCPRARWPAPTPSEVGSNAVIEGVLDGDQRGFLIDRSLPHFGLWPRAQVEAVGRHTWVQPRQLLDIPSCGDRTFTCRGPLGAPAGELVALVKGDKVHFENSPALIDLPYEWSLVPRTGEAPAELYILLPPGISPDANLIVPRTRTLLRLTGCSGIRFQGICFAFSHAPFPSSGGSAEAPAQGVPGYDPGQSGHDRVVRDCVLPGAIEMSGVSGCELLRCRIAHTGGNGVMAQGSAVTIQECEIFDTGGTAVYLGPFGSTWKHRSPSPGAMLRDCWIHDFGRVYQDCAAVWAAWTPRLTIRNNRIARGGYSGISVGWSWNHAAQSAPGECPTYNVSAIMEGTVIVQNDVSEVMREQVDGGGIYMLGSQGGPESAQLRGNWVHDINRNITWRYGTCTGLYFDEGSDGWTVADNVVERTNRLIEFNTFSRDGLPNGCSGCISPCPAPNPYGHATWHSEFRSDNGRLWPGQTWPEDRWNYFDRDPTKPPGGWGTVGLPRAWNMAAKGEPLQARAIRANAGTRNEFVFAHCPAVHPPSSIIH